MKVYKKLFNTGAFRAFYNNLSPEILALLASLLFTLIYNDTFWAAVLHSNNIVCRVFFIGLLITGVQWFLLLLVINRWNAKLLLSLLLFLTAPAVYFMSKYGVYFNKNTMRNIFQTDLHEASELFNWAIIPYWFGYSLFPCFFLWQVQFARISLRRAFKIRIYSLVTAIIMIITGLGATMNYLLPVFHEHKELRYLITPSNLVISFIRYITDPVVAIMPIKREIIAEDAYRIATTTVYKPQAIVLVVGETVRAANWGLNDYVRQTTPKLAKKRDVVNFPNFFSCGTDTATSLPCMFSLYGRVNYNEKKIRGTESLLHVLNRIGVDILWRDNQSGCKGVCDGLPLENLSKSIVPNLCDGTQCFDGILLQGLRKRILSTQGDILIILHMAGSHGPTYYHRYPHEFRHFIPTCNTADLSSCSRESLVNTYDNTILYTDHILASLIDELDNISSHNTAMVYVSDHGESLGEKKLYLHGVPYIMAPEEQIHVPMVIWLSSGMKQFHQLDLSCLKQLATADVISHDNLFHTLLGWFNVQTQSYNSSLDIMRPCKK